MKVSTLLLVLVSVTALLSTSQNATSLVRTAPLTVSEPTKKPTMQAEPFDFELIVSPTSATAMVSAPVATFMVTVSPTRGTAEPVTLSASCNGCYDATFTVNSRNPPYTSELYIQTFASKGTYSITVEGTAKSGVTHKATVSLGVGAVTCGTPGNPGHLPICQ